MSTQKHKRQLLASGDIVEKLYYGPFAVNWWVFTGIKTKTAQTKQICIPIRVNMRTRFSGPGVLGFDNEIITKQLQAEVLVFPLQIIIHGIKVFVATLGSSDQAELNFA
ncbi:hypothetical protein RhiirA1_427732, partial [Rhizophagus irregularis]